MDDKLFGHLPRGGAVPVGDLDGPDSTDSVLEALQRAVEEQAEILDRQGRLIRRLRAELNGVEQRGE